MADIELVIKIHEEKYNTIKSDLYGTFPAEMKEWGLEAIRNGTPLPKGHGDLIDADKVIAEAMELMKYPKNHTYMECVIAHMKLASTIIEAYKTESEDKE